jgi:NAD-dependent dihydropyrimidine dehydrogenase PreA subunit
MTQRVLPVWAGERLTYLRPMAVIRALGYEPTYDNLPESDARREHMFAHVADQDGPVASTPTASPPADGEAATSLVTNWAHELGADDVGFTTVDPAYVYDGADLPHRYVVMLAMAMTYDEIALAPSARTNAEVMRIYASLADLSIELARRIRALGFRARAHTLAHEEIAFIPHAVAAGLGELGKHGSLLHPHLGASLRLAAVTTDLPLVLDRPTTERVADLCLNCSLCVDHCPGDAISHEPIDVRGASRWIVDTERCAPYWASFHACAICLQVCPWNARTGPGPVRELFIRTIKGIDRDERRKQLQAEVRPAIRPPSIEVNGSAAVETPT